MYNGKLITFEGIDGSGKTTQINLLKEYLIKNDYNIIVLREPGGTKVGEKIRDILLDNRNKINPITEALLYASSRAELVSEIIIPSLKSGKIVILDRFVDSSIAYQGYARGIGIDTIRAVNNIAILGLKPDLTIFLDIKPEEAIKRVSHRQYRDRLEEENVDFYKKVYTGYMYLIKERPERFTVIDGKQSVSEVQYNIIKELKKII